MSAPAVSAVTTIQKNGREDVQIALDDFHGIDLIDIRVFAAFDDTGQRKQTKKGVSLKIGKLPSLIEALQETEVEVRRRRLLGAEK